MWESIKKLASQAVERGASFLRHSAAINQVLSYPTQDSAVLALKNYVFSLETADEFQRFKQTIVQQHGLTQVALQQAQANAGNSWGASTEDRIAYLQAHIQAGEPAGVSAETQAAQMRLNGLIVMYQIVDQMWAEAEQSRAASGQG